MAGPVVVLLVSPDDEDRPWLERIRLLDDAPIVNRSQDALEFSGLVDMMAGSLRDARGPMVVHVDGSWGRGKTSYCHLLEQTLWEGSSEGGQINTAWYIASDDGASARDALLETVAQAVTGDDAEQIARVARLWGGQAGEAAKDFESFRRWVGRELGWPKERTQRRDGPRHTVTFDVPEIGRGEGSGPGPNDPAAVAGDAAGQAHPLDIGPEPWTLTIPQTPRRRAVIFIDDLDRCRPERVLEVFDAVRGFTTCRGLIFVVAADREVIVRAFDETVAQLGATGTRRAEQAMEKYIQHDVTLPDLGGFSTYLTSQLGRLQAQLMDGGDDSLLRGPGTWLSDGVAVLLAQTFGESLTLRRLKRLLNTLIVELATAAEGRSRQDIERETRQWLESLGPQMHIEPHFRMQSSYAPYFVGRLIANAARFMWPDLLEGFEHSDEFDKRIGALLALVRQLDRWPELKLEQAIDQIVPPSTSGVVTSRSVQQAFCQFLARICESLEASALEPPPPPPPPPEPQRAPASDEKPRSVLEAELEEPAEPASAPRKVELPASALRSVARAGEQALRSDFVPGVLPSAKAPAPQRPEEVIRGSIPTPPPPERTRGLEGGTDTEQALRSLHRELNRQLDPLPDEVGAELVADVLNKADLLLSARLGHSSFDPTGVVAGTRKLVDRASTEDLVGVASYLLSVAIVVRRWRLQDDATTLMCTLWSVLQSSAADDPAISTTAVAYLLEDLCQPGALDPSAPLLPLWEQFDDGTRSTHAGVGSRPSRLGQATMLVDRAGRALMSLGVGHDVHAHFARAIAGFERAIEDARLEVPRSIHETRQSLEKHYRESFTNNPSPALALQLVHILARGREHDRGLLDRIYGLTREGQEPELSLALADIYLEVPERRLHNRAFKLYRQLQGTPLWTPAVLHNLATLQAAREGGQTMAGRYWELAYRAGYRDARMLRAFSQFLKREDMPEVALVVVRGGELRKDWHPFGAVPPQSEVHVPPEMNRS